MGSAPELPCAAWQLRLVPIPDVSDSLDRYQFDLRTARVGGTESTCVSHYVAGLGSVSSANDRPRRRSTVNRQIRSAADASSITLSIRRPVM